MADSFFKFDENHKPTDPRYSVNPKKHEEIQTKAHHNQIA